MAILREVIEAAQEGTLDAADAAALLQGLADGLEAVVDAKLLPKLWQQVAALAVAGALRQVAKGFAETANTGTP